MMNKLVILSSLLFTACSAPQHPAPAPPPTMTTTTTTTTSSGPPSATCKAEGPILFESETRPTQIGGELSVPLRSTIVYETGGLTYVEHTKGDKTGAATGCLPSDKLAKIREDLEHSAWKASSPSGIRCMAMSMTYEEYSSHGKVLWNAVLCGDKVLDAESQRNLTEIVALLNDAVTATAPPCCKK